MNLSGFLRIGTICLLAACWAATAVAAGQRSTLQIFRYAATDTAEELAAFSRFEDVVSAKILSLHDELAERITLPGLGALKLVKVYDEANKTQASATELSADDVDAFWTQRGALALLIGRMQKQNQAFQVRTRFYLGSLRGDLAGPFVSIDLAVRDEEFDSTRDSHSAMTLYALAMDSLNDCGKRAAVTGALSEALSRAEGSQNAFGNFAELRTAISKAMQSVKEHCP